MVNQFTLLEGRKNDMIIKNMNFRYFITIVVLIFLPFIASVYLPIRFTFYIIYFIFVEVPLGIFCFVLGWDQYDGELFSF